MTYKLIIDHNSPSTILLEGYCTLWEFLTDAGYSSIYNTMGVLGLLRGDKNANPQRFFQ